MKKSFILFVIVSIIFSACEKDNIKAVISNNAGAPEILIPETTLTVTLTAADSAQLFPIRWKKADYGVQTVVNYAVQADKAGNNFGSAVSLGSTSSDSLLFNFHTLNSKLRDEMKLPAGTPSNIELRIVASFRTDTVISDPVAFTVTPYQAVVPEVVHPALYIAGDFQGWDIGNAFRISAFKTPGIYEGYINIPGGSREFKLYTLKDWNSASYGDGGAGLLIEANCACSNFMASENGYYQFTADLNTMQYTLSPTTWGIIGDATPGGWDNSTPMTYNPATQMWTVTANMIAGGSWKFRANNSWAINFGIGPNGKLTYADHPVFGSVSGINNITVPSDGNYTITLDLHDANKYTYSAVKNP